MIKILKLRKTQKVGKKQKTNEETELQRIQNAIKTKTMNGKPLTDKQIEGLKAGLTQGGNKVEMERRKKNFLKQRCIVRLVI